MPEPEREDERGAPRQENNQERSGQNQQGRQEGDGRGREDGPSEAEREAQEQVRRAEENVRRLNERRIREAATTINELSARENRTQAEEDRLTEALNIFNEQNRGAGGQQVDETTPQGLDRMMDTAEGLSRLEQLYQADAGIRDSINRDEGLRQKFERQRAQLRDLEARQASLMRPGANPMDLSNTVYAIYDKMMSKQWSSAKQEIWVRDRFREFARKSDVADSPESETAFTLLKSSAAIIRETQLKDQFGALTKMYLQYAKVINATDLEPIQQGVNDIKAETLNEFMRTPYVADGMKLWEKHSAYQVDADKAPVDRHGKILTSILYLDGRAVEYRKVEMISEMTSTVLAKQLEDGYIKPHKDRYIEEFRGQGLKGEDLDRAVQMRLIEEGVRDRYKNQARNEVKNLAEELQRETGLIKEEDEKNAGDYEKDELARQERMRQKKEIIAAFIKDNHPALFTAWRDDAKENRLEDIYETDKAGNVTETIKSDEELYMVMAQHIWNDAEFGVTFGQVGQRVLERAALLDAMNPYYETIDGRGENPLRRLFVPPKYYYELWRDGKLKHVDQDIINHLINPVQDFLSLYGKSFWSKQQKPVYDWWLKTIRNPDKVDKYGRLLDMSDCPFELIDFRVGNDAFNRGVMYSHYSNFVEPAEQVRKVLLKSGGFLENGTFKNFMEVAQSLRNIRWGEGVPNGEKTEEIRERRLEAEMEARRHGYWPPHYEDKEPMPVREEVTMRALRGLMKSWQKSNMYTKEAIAVAILEAADETKDPVITQAQAKKLLRELYWPAGPFYPLAIVARKMRLGVALWDMLTETVKKVASSK